MVRVAFVHPDLGIGGAERLVVDAALALQSKGHDVSLFTSHHDPSHCFAETRDGTLPVTVYGDWLPRHIFGKFYAFCAYLRMIFTAVAMAWASRSSSPFDVIFVDQISACIPFLKLVSPASRIIFYCHFPDQLLTQRKSFWKKIYRAPIDWMEETTTGSAHSVLVNSGFTAGVFRDTFTSLSNIQPNIVYPSINFAAFDKPSTAGEGSRSRTRSAAGSASQSSDASFDGRSTVFLSINRFERKKNVRLALEALQHIKAQLPKEQWGGVKLVVAGGYDERLQENREYYQELVDFVQENKLQSHVTFKRSFSDEEKLQLLRSCTCLLYTPSNEHFGIGPLEGMYMERPVIAVNSGGPLETVADGKTGFLRDPTPDAFGEAMLAIVQNPRGAKEMGLAGRKHVIEMFSFQAFANQLDEQVTSVLKPGSGAQGDKDKSSGKSRKGKGAGKKKSK